MVLKQIVRGTKTALTLGLLASCGISNRTNQDNFTPNVTSGTSPQTPTVVVTTTVLCDLTQKIAQDTVNLICLLKPGIDAHVYELLPEDRKAIENAKLILYSGYNLEPELIKLIKATSNPVPKIAVAEEAVPKPLLGEEHEHGHKEHEEHEEHTHQEEAEGEKVPDPHVWQNAQNGVRMVEVVESHLEKLVPEKAELYRQNAQTLKTELTQIDSWIKSQIATIPQGDRKLITTHDALLYYGDAYGIPVAGALQGLSTDEKPTATRIKELVKDIKVNSVPTIFAEVAVNPKLIEAVAKDAQVKISQQELFSDSLGEPGSEGDTYPKMLITNTKTIVEGLGGKFVPFQSQ